VEHQDRDITADWDMGHTAIVVVVEVVEEQTVQVQ
jgi:hypothetical protein